MKISRQLLIAPRQSKAQLLSASLVALYGFSMLPGPTQEYSPYSKAGDPNLKHFYMGRQEIEVFDNTPIVKYRGGEGGNNSGAPGSQGSVPLPASGFQQYSSSVHGGPLNLPKVENGIPHQAPPPPPSSLKGNAGKLKAGRHRVSSGGSGPIGKTAPLAGRPAIKTYQQTYQSRPQPATASGTTGLSSTQKVHGKLLPWANTRHKNSY